jgi:hypothetical protein
MTDDKIALRALLEKGSRSRGQSAEGDFPDAVRRDSKVTSLVEVSFGPGSVER